MSIKQTAKIAGKAFLRFIKINYLMVAYIFASVLIELTGIAVTSGKFYMTSPWLFLSFIALVCLISQYIPNHKARYAFFMCLILINFILDFIFIVIFDSTGGTVFEYAMLSLRNDAMIIVEVIPMSFAFIFVSGIIIALYGTLGFMFTKRVEKPNVAFSAKITTAALCALVILGNSMLAFFGNYRFDSNDLTYKLHQQETGTYANKGIVGNMYNELVRGLWFSDIDVGDKNELNRFIYKSTTEPTPLTGEADGFNVVTILCESFEWFTFLYDAERYPNGFAKSVNGEAVDEAYIKSALKRLYPNFYRIYDSKSTIILNNAHSLEKTDISENKSILGNYPLLYQYVNYGYPENSLPYSMPNVLKTLFGVESNSFHNGDRTFYNRDIHHTNALGFKSYTAGDEMYPPDEDGGGLGERRLDSVMFDVCKEKMFPTDRRFNTYITTITMHGQYAERENLQDYYAQMDEYGILPYVEDDEDANALRYYCAAGMDTDKAIGVMLDYLDQNGLADNTLITMFGDHNAYYQGISNYAKNIYFTDQSNYTDLYRVPVMIKVGNRNLEAHNVNRVVTKFTCTCDIYPTVLDLLGVTVFSNLTYGVSAFSPDESILYSRAYDKFLTDKIYFNSLSNIIYQADDVDDAYLADIEQRATVLLDKISHLNRIFAADYFKGSRKNEFNTMLHSVNEQPIKSKQAEVQHAA
ncbi:MAG: sulfatase-like hydrolase/transferase [Clostridiales bacterium]|nr:sulfatase-like hydrolase/transferase [Clostridiales bacterium]